MNPVKQEVIKHSYRGALPDDALGFEGVRSQIPVAQGGRTGWELLILEQGASLQALPLQGSVVLLQILDGIPVGSEPVCGRSFLAEPCHDPGHGCSPSRRAAQRCRTSWEVNIGR